MTKIKVPATTANLGPGFDTLGMALDLYNRLEVREIKAGLRIEVEGCGQDTLPTDKSNLVYRAIEQVFTELDYSPSGLQIKLKNRIPLARGLGSSAAAIVGGMAAANKLAGDQLSTAELLNQALKLEDHPDNITPALVGGLVVSTLQKGEVLYKKIAVPTVKAVVCIPDYEVSTAEARQVLPKQVSLEDAVFNVSHTGLLLTGFLTEDYQLVRKALQDKLHQPYRESLVPGAKTIIEELSTEALGMVLSGSGPTVVALTLEKEQEIGRKMVDIFAEQNIEAEYLVTNPTNRGLIIEDC